MIRPNATSYILPCYFQRYSRDYKGEKRGGGGGGGGGEKGLRTQSCQERRQQWSRISWSTPTAPRR